MDKKLFVKGATSKYPEEELLVNRVEIEASVVACIWKDPLLMEETQLRKDLFLTEDGRFFYSMAAQLKKKGLYSLDEVAVISNSSEEVLKVLESKGGYEVIENMTEIIDTSNFSVYLDQLYRENNILKLYDMGFNLFKSIKWEKRDVVPIEVFRKMTSEQVMDFYLVIIGSLEVGESAEVVEEEYLDLDDEWVQSLIDGEESGIPFAYAFPDMDGNDTRVYKFLSNNILGLLPGTTTMLGGFSSVGKSTFWIGIIVSMVAQGNKVMIISNEEKATKYKTKLTTWIAKNIFHNTELAKRKVQGGLYEDKEGFELVRQWYQENMKGKIRFLKIKDANMKVIQKKVREYALKEGFNVLIYDTFKIQASDMKNERQDLALVKDTRALDQLAVKYNLISLCSLQLAEGMKGKLWLNASCLSNSKQIKEQLENLLLMRNLNAEELDPSSKYYVHPFKLKKINGKWVEEECTLDPSYTWKMLFIEKARSGANSEDTNTAYIFRFDGDFSTFVEYCSCRPRHGQIA